ncbi:MOSC domain-containing protein [Agromyces mediolanus]|uniref:MOSC domain-containing protein n=1 Tax=Agromyces mediolanus TaxID=41986 RepID=UPI003833324F
MQVTRVRIHPVKSFAGLDVPSATVLPWGLAGDRRWAVVDPEGTSVTAREENALLGLVATPLDDDALRLVGARAGGSGPAEADDALLVAAPRDAVPVAVGHSRQGTALPAGEAADAWISARLGRPLRLVWQPDPTARTVKPDYGGRPGDSLTLADASPLLLASEASLRLLNELAAADADERGELAPEPLVMERFRPNLVVDGETAFAEETWTRVRIGDVEFRVEGCCDRCVMTTIDPETLVRGKEPIRTLARHRRREGKTWFGVRLVPALDASAGDTVSVGDALHVLG